ncbi:MAG TPA: ATP-binding protein, partial [Erysipelothrix sp.]|nr:ATP-binding protein [Erysipelothrix sp.]
NRLNLNQILTSLFLITFIIAIGTYFVIQYFVVNKERMLIYFGLILLLHGLYLSLMEEQLLYFLWKYSFNQRIFMQSVSIIGTSILLPTLVREIYGEYLREPFRTIYWSIICFMTPLIVLFALLDLPYLMNGSLFIYLSIIIGVLFFSVYKLFSIINFNEMTTIYAFIFGLNISFYLLFNFIRVVFTVHLFYLPYLLAMGVLLSGVFLITHVNKINSDRVRVLTDDLFENYTRETEFISKLTKKLGTTFSDINYQLQMINQEGQLSSKQMSHLTIINHYINTISSFIDRMEESTGLTSEDEHFALETMNVHAVIQVVIEDLRLNQRPSYNLTLENRFPIDAPTINSNSKRLYTVIYQVINNAIENTPSGSIVVSGHVEDDVATVIIKDTGIGIEKKNLNKIFTHFYQIKPDDDKFGLGLPVSKRLIESLGGSIKITSKLNTGTTCTLTLPSKDVEIEDHMTFCTCPEAKSSDTILLVTDVNLETSHIMTSLREKGYNVRHVPDIDGLEYHLNNSQLSLIILGWTTDKIQFNYYARKVRKQASSSSLPLLLLGTPQTLTSLEMIEDLDIDAYLQRPLNIDTLVANIDFLLTSKRAVEKGRLKELRYLYSQISPHFLHNAINNIIGISYRDTESSRKMLANLSIYLRAKLNIHSQNELIHLDDEVELLLAYLDIEKLRFDDTLELDIDIDETLNAKIPPLTLQPLAENSIVHGYKQGKKLKLSIGINRVQDEFIEITIRDNGRGISKQRMESITQGTTNRVGLKSVVDRIDLLRNAKISIESEEDIGTMITILIKEEREL